MKKNQQKGITLITLSITIIILIILASIVFYTGKESIKKADLEGLKTNMLLIETKAKEYVENANFKLGINPNVDTMYEKAKENLIGEEKGTVVTVDDEIVKTLLEIGIEQEDIEKGKVYKLTTENLQNMGIQHVNSNDEDGWYIILYNLENATAEIYNTKGYEGKYSLTDIKEFEM